MRRVSKKQNTTSSNHMTRKPKNVATAQWPTTFWFLVSLGKSLYLNPIVQEPCLFLWLQQIVTFAFMPFYRVLEHFLICVERSGRGKWSDWALEWTGGSSPRRRTSSAPTARGWCSPTSSDQTLWWAQIKTWYQSATGFQLESNFSSFRKIPDATTTRGWMWNYSWSMINLYQTHTGSCLALPMSSPNHNSDALLLCKAPLV